ncbi:MAG: ribosomal protein L7/L12 [Acidobacteriota bacterium]
MEKKISREISDKIELLICEGKKIEAIKEIRKVTEWGLKESKEYADNLTIELYEKYPGKFKYDPTKSKGCGTAALFFVLSISGIFYLLV